MFHDSPKRILNGNYDSWLIVVMQEERGLAKYNEAMEFIATNQRNLLRHRLEELLVLNWSKHNWKLMNKGRQRKCGYNQFVK